jgi:FkbM family methyltransferase
MPLQHPLFGRFYPFSAQIDAGFEAWFYGVKVRDWLFTGKTKNLPGGPVSVGHPTVNCEYFEWLTLMAAVLSAKDHFTMVECGAGWGRWLAAAAQLARQRKLSIHLLGVEGDACHFDWMQTVLRDNGVRPEEQHLECAIVSSEVGEVQFLTSDDPSTFYGQRIVTPREAVDLHGAAGFRCNRRTAVTLAGILAQVQCADLVSIDLGRCEDEVVASALDELRAKARVIQIHTATEESHQRLETTFETKGWRLVFNFPPGRASETFAGPVNFDQGLQVWAGEREQAMLDWIDPRVENVYPVASVSPAMHVGSSQAPVFDTEDALAINQARLQHLASLGLPLDHRKVLDVGCGVGHLARFFVERGCAVTCIDVRQENVSRLRKIYPDMEAQVFNVENQALSRLGRFEVVFCYGLLYHLESPLAALRNIASVCDDLLLIETVVTDHAEPLLRLVDEPVETCNQAAAGLANRPTPAFVAMALNRVGFPYVYGPIHPADHPDFRFEWKNDLEWSRQGHLLRCVFVASRTDLALPALRLLVGVGPEVEPATFVPLVQGAAPRAWIDVGPGEKSFEAAKDDPNLRVYSFEPDLEIASARFGQLANYVTLPMAVGQEDGAATFHRNAVRVASSLRPLHEEGLARWKGGDQFRIEEERIVPVTRLDTFLKGIGLTDVEYLQVDALGDGLAVVQSAGDCLAGIRKISLVVQTTPVPLYVGASTAEDTKAWLRAHGFELVAGEERSFGQEEILTFVRTPDLLSDEEGSLLARARQLATFGPLDPEPGWKFDTDWNSPDPVIRERRAIWEHFNRRGHAGPLTLDWLDGIRLTLYLGNDLSRQIFCLGRYEPNEFAWLSRLLKPGMCVVDVGANEGVYTLFAASRVGAEGQVWAFEPSPREFARLAANCAQNRLEHVRLFRSALSAENGTASLAILDGAHAGQNLLEQPTGLPVLRRELVCVERFDDVATREDLRRLDVLKIDIEGEEFRALRGAEQSIRRFRPNILFECSDRLLRGRGASASQLRELLAGWGYQICAFDAASGLPVPYSEGDDLNLVAIAQ